MRLEGVIKTNLLFGDLAIFSQIMKINTDYKRDHVGGNNDDTVTDEDSDTSVNDNK